MGLNSSRPPRLDTRVREFIRKNGPFLRAASVGEVPPFVVSPIPVDSAGSIPVFCHHVVEEGRFRTDLEYLHVNGYGTAGADALSDYLETGDAARPNTVVLTVDDGHVSLYRNAFPLLREFGMKAVAFVAPGLHRPAAEWERRGIADADDRPCSWEELREMERSGHVDVQSHTLEHRYVPEWPRPVPYLGSRPGLVADLRGEPLPLHVDLRRAKEALDDALDKDVRHLAFPMFDGTDAALDAAVDAGYDACWWGLVEGRRYNRPGASPLTILRHDAKFLRRLPGRGRISLVSALWDGRARRPLAG